MTQTGTNIEVWNSISLDLISIQVDGRIVFINNAGATMLGASTPRQLIGKPILDFVHPDYQKIATERVLQLVTDGMVICPSEEKWVRLDGTTIDVEVAAMPIVYEGKSAVQLIVREDNGGGPYWAAHHRYAASKSRRGHR